MVDLLSLILLVAYLLLHSAQIDVFLHLLKSTFIQLVLLTLLRRVAIDSTHVIFVEGREPPEAVTHEVDHLSCCCFDEDVNTQVVLFAVMGWFYLLTGETGDKIGTVKADHLLICYQTTLLTLSSVLRIH
jgi:hypothetical protein